MLRQREERYRQFTAGILVVFLVIPFLLFNTTTAYADEANITFGQSEYTVQQDETFEVEVSIKADNNIGVYEVQLQYDTSRLAYVSGAEEEADGIITLMGTGWGDTVTYDNLTFQAVSGGNAGLTVKEAHIYSNADEITSYDINTSATLPINVEGEDNGEQSFMEKLIQQEKVQATLDTYGIETDLPVVGSLKMGEQVLYVLDISDYEPQIELWNYKLVTDEYLGENLTFFTDQSRTVRVMLTMDADQNFYLLAFNKDRNGFYSVKEISEDGQNYYMISLNACQNLPNRMTQEEINSNTIFFAVDMEGKGNYYRYTTDGKMTKWEPAAEQEDASVDAKQNGKGFIMIAAGVAVCVAATVGVILFFVKKRRKIKRKVKKQFDLFNENVADRKQYFFVIQELTSREIKRKYARSYLGIIWSVLNPLLTMCVMSVIFSYMFKRSIDNFPLYYLTGNIFWTLFSGSTNSAMTALVDNKNLLLKAKLPKQTFVLSRIYTALTNFGYTCIAYVFMLIIFRIKPTWTMLLFPLDVILALLFATGIGHVLAILYVFFADIKYLYSVLLTMLLYMSAIFYPVTSLPPVLQKIIGYNPVYMSIYIARETVVYNHMPHYTAWLKLALSAAVSLAIGIYVFKKKENDVMQRV